jgi:hypothetical protein
MTKQRVFAWDRGKVSGGLKRKVGFREIKPRLLIVCEGKRTEPNYFRGFRLTNVELVVEGAGMVHVSVVQKAIEMKAKYEDYQEVWCVFDRDKHTANPNDEALFNEAIETAKANDILVAYSNDAFELWYLLHFQYIDNQILRADYITKLKLKLGAYKKNDRKMYDKLESKLPDAIKNAKKLYKNCDQNDPANADPSTTVFQLVERLKELQ